MVCRIVAQSRTVSNKCYNDAQARVRLPSQSEPACPFQPVLLPDITFLLMPSEEWSQKPDDVCDPNHERESWQDRNRGYQAACRSCHARSPGSTQSSWRRSAPVQDTNQPYATVKLRCRASVYARRGGGQQIHSFSALNSQVELPFSFRTS
jgi:hypothetical protein